MHIDQAGDNRILEQLRDRQLHYVCVFNIAFKYINSNVINTTPYESAKLHSAIQIGDTNDKIQWN